MEWIQFASKTDCVLLKSIFFPERLPVSNRHRPRICFEVNTENDTHFFRYDRRILNGNYQRWTPRVTFGRAVRGANAARSFAKKYNIFGWRAKEAQRSHRGLARADGWCVCVGRGWQPPSRVCTRLLYDGRPFDFCVFTHAAVSTTTMARARRT